MIEVGELTIDVPRRTVEVRGQEAQLTFVEFELLRVLAGAPGRVFSRRQLLERLRGGADYREPRTIDVHVRHLREKIEHDPHEPKLILTVRGSATASGSAEWPGAVPGFAGSASAWRWRSSSSSPARSASSI